MIRRSAFLVAVMVLSVVPVVSASASEPDGAIDFDGSGLGHGVGMSQYGTFDRAQKGQTHAQILADYYRTSTLGTLGLGGVPAVERIFTNVASDITSTVLTVLPGPGSPDTGIVVTRDPGPGGAAAPSATLATGTTITIVDTTPNVGEPGGCAMTIKAGTDTTEWGVGSCDLDATLTAPGGEPTNLISATNCRRPTQCTYGYGWTFHVVDNVSPYRSQHDCYGQPCGPNNELAYAGFDLVVETSMDEYTRGISEVPYSWPTEALRTQAVAARSYGAATALTTNHMYAGCFCDIKNSSADQVYAGWTRSWPYGTAWEAAADATAGKVLRHGSAPDGGIVKAYYSSSNGGASEASVDKWGGYRPYLISIPDPYSLTSANSYAYWTRTFSTATVIDKVWGTNPAYDEWRVISADVIENHASGSAKKVRFTADAAEQGTQTREMDVADVASRFGLPSWFFSINDARADGTPPKTVPPGGHSVGLQDPQTGIWSIKMPSGAVKTFYYGDPNDEPFIGDWDGDGIETVGLYRRSAGFLFIRNSNTQGVADIDIYYGIPGDIPIAGDWNGNGTDTVGIYRPSDAKFYLRNTNTQGIADIVVPFGVPGDQPIAGDWNGDGKDTIGVYRPSTKMVYLTNNLATGSVAVSFPYTGTVAGDRVITGDWDDDGDDTLGVFRPSTGTFYLRDTYTQSAANVVFQLGDPWMNPVAGYWGG